MNKKLNILKYILFIISFILLVYIRFLDNTLTLPIILFYILYMLLILLDLKNYKKNNKDIYYEIALLLVMILIIIILLRTIFDDNIITVKYLNNFDSNLKLAFFKNNLVFINIMLLSLLGYRLIKD